MVWLILIAILFLLVYSSGFRKFAVGVLVVIILGTLIIIGKLESDNKKYTKELEQEKREKEQELQRKLTNIKPSELIFEDFSLEPSYKALYLVGRIQNTSPKYALTDLTIRVQIKDISPLDQSGVIIGETSLHINETIPPNQARDIKELLSLPEMKPKRQLGWSYSIERIKGE